MQLSNMKKSVQILISVLTLFFLIGGSVSAVEAAARLYLDPSSANKTVNETFTVTAKVDSAGEVIGGVDGIGTYDSSRLELVSITKASDMVFGNLDTGGSCQIGTSSGGKFSFTCYANTAVDNTAVSGSLVVFSFKAKATGTATVNFSCTDGSTVDSNIVKTSTSADIISCSSNGSGTYTISEGSSSTTTTATNTPTPTSTTTTTELPQTGTVGVTVGLVVFGLISLASAVFLKFL
jgi:hypothetical protein